MRATGSLWIGVIGAACLTSVLAAPAFGQEARHSEAMAMPDAGGPMGSAGSPAEAQATDQAPAVATPTGFWKSTTAAASVDVYYSQNFDGPNDGVTPLRNFDEYQNVNLNLLKLAFEKKPAAESRGGFRLDLNYAPHTTDLIHGADPAKPKILRNVEQAYVSYLAPAGSGLQIDFGEFVTQHGAEVIESKDNWNYSRSLLFALAIPYYHMGLRATYAVNDKLSLMGNVVNGWNDVVDNNGGKTVGAQIAYKPTAALSLVQNYMTGPEQSHDSQDRRSLFDTIATYMVSPSLSLMANYDYGRDTVAGEGVTWKGIAGYFRYQATPWLAFSPRAEYYSDPDGFMTGTPQSVKEATVTAELKHSSGALVRIEYRHDFSDVPFFPNEASGLQTNQNTFTVGLMYAFGPRAF